MPRYIVETALIAAIAIFVFIQSTSEDIASSAATLAIFLSGGLRLTASLLPLQTALLTLKQSTPSANRALDLLSPNDDSVTNREVEFTEYNLSPPVSVQIKELHFRYVNSPKDALHNVSLGIPAGSQAAFIGTSGAGKSTLADILLGLLEPSQGLVSIGDLEPRMAIRNYPGILGYVPQRPGMISGTIAENIALGIEPHKVNQTQLLKAVADAHLQDFIGSLPNGLSTNIGKRKDELSGGQLQRIGLARALYTQPRLLLMDEATSSLDAESENEINIALNNMRGRVTVILIAHRLNTIQRSDVVFLLETGRVTASGTFPELMKSNEKVRNLAQLMSIEAE
jgi:ATP-binding cassette subfamily C protein